MRTYWWLAVLLIGLPGCTVAFLELFRAMPTNRLAFLFFGQAFINPLATLLVALDRGGDQDLADRHRLLVLRADVHCSDAPERRAFVASRRPASH